METVRIIVRGGMVEDVITTTENIRVIIEDKDVDEEGEFPVTVKDEAAA